MTLPPTGTRARSVARVAIAIAIAGATLTGCGSASDDDASAAATSSSSPTAANDSGEASSTPPPSPSTTADPTGSSAGDDSGSDDSAGDGPGGRTPTPYTGRLVPRVLTTHPHDERSFTQGLEWYDGVLLESTGLEGESSLRLVDVVAGTAIEQIDVDNDLFAEGVTVVDDRAIQLTWKDQTLLETDLRAMGDGAAAMTRLPDAYDGEGWGLCHDGDSLVMSDGSASLTFRDPTSFAVTGTVEVTRNGTPIEQLNELECVGGQVWANIWLTEEIIAIDPGTGLVDASLDASSLVPAGYENVSDNVLNGIAYNHDTGTFWVTGKRWPVLYEIELVPAG